MAIQKIGQVLAKTIQDKTSVDGALFAEPTNKTNQYISKQTQLRALQLARQFNDEEHKIQYLNLCKNVSEVIIEQAASFVTDATARKQGALFMWKVKQIKTQWEQAGKNWRRIKDDDEQKSSKPRRQRAIKTPSLFD